MDTLFWTTLNPNITVEETTKQFYGRFFYRLVINAPGARSIDAKVSINVALEQRRAYARSYNYGGSWWGGRERALVDNADPVLLNILKDVKQLYAEDIRMRIEEPNVQIYSEDLQVLHTIAARINSATLMNDTALVSISMPRNEAAKEMLRNGVIIKKNAQEFKYKIMFKDGRYSQTAKTQILNYLMSLEDTVKVPLSSQRMLTNTFESCWGVYFYSKDVSIITFIKLIEPTIVSNIHELTVLEQ